MGIYAITGGSGGIGGQTVKLLKEAGHEVINIDLKGGDISANLASPEGRREAIEELHQKCTEGLDGMICNAGVSGAVGNLQLIVSLNYFGTIEIAKGVSGLLRKKKGCCVVTSSNTISQGAGRMDLVDLLNNSGNEQMILNLISKWDQKDLTVGNSIYVATKYALARWVRRISSSWAARGVRVNAVAPGNVQTPMTAALQGSARDALNALPIPARFGQEALMEAEEIAGAIVFLTSKYAAGINGNILFVDGGTDALLNSEKVY